MISIWKKLIAWRYQVPTRSLEMVLEKTLWQLINMDDESTTYA